MDPAKGEDEHQKSPTERENKAEQEKKLTCSSLAYPNAEINSLEEDDDDFFQLDPAKLSESLGSSQYPNAAAHNGESEVISDPNGFLSIIGDNCSVPNQPVGEQPSLVTSTYPQVQMMDRLDVVDPNRIPSSIFTRSKSTTPAEWSMTSNDSLFSINFGNPSFSKDQTISAAKAGDISPRSGRPSEAQKMQMTGFSNSDAWRMLEEPSAARGVKAKGIKEDDATTNPVNLSCHSDNSVSSFHSFAFPILAGGEGISSSGKVEPTQPIIVQQAKPPQPPSQPERPKQAPPRGKHKWISYVCCCSSCF